MPLSQSGELSATGWALITKNMMIASTMMKITTPMLAGSRSVLLIIPASYAD